MGPDGWLRSVQAGAPTVEQIVPQAFRDRRHPDRMIRPEATTAFSRSCRSRTGGPPGRPLTLSFIVIAYNDERTIGDCLSHILGQDGVDDVDVRVIVVDDGSVDRTASLVEELAHRHPQITLVRLGRNQGRGAARAAGLEVATGQFIAFVDADILLPPHWLSTCIGALGDADAVGGIAVPDGDVAFIANRFKLRPKVVRHATAVSGSNGLYRSAVFSVAGFDADRRYGEDVALMHAMDDAGFTTRALDDLVVEHVEDKGTVGTARWMFQQGVGASRQLRDHRKIRTPDLAFLGAVGATAAAAAAAVRTRRIRWVLGAPAAVLAISFVHVWTKFERKGATPARWSLAALAHGGILSCYFAGRFVGLGHTPRPARDLAREASSGRHG